HPDRLALRQAGDLVVDRTWLPAADLQDQPGDVLDVLDGGRRVDAALEAVGGIRGEVEATRTTGNRRGPPERGLDVDVGRVEAHGGGLAAHDAGQALDLAIVGDHPDLLVELDGLAVEQLQCLAGAAPAHGKAPVDLREVEHGGGAPALQHHVVGDVDQGRDRTLTGALEPRPQPGGWPGAGIPAANNPPGEAATRIGAFDVYRQPIGDCGGNRLELRVPQGRPGQGGEFARHPEHPEAVREVG